MPNSCTGADAPIDLESLPQSSFLTRAQLAPAIGFSVVTLKRWAGDGEGPHITYLGRNRPRYRVRDVLEWIESAEASQ